MGQVRDLHEIYELAQKMARSGRFCSWRLIAIELRYVQGVREANDEFFDRGLREELDGLCRAAQKASGTWPAPARALPGSRVPAIPRPVPAIPKPVPVSALARAPFSPPVTPRTAPARSMPPATPPATSVPATSVPSVSSASAHSSANTASPPATSMSAPSASTRARPALALEAAPQWVPKYRS